MVDDQKHNDSQEPLVDQKDFEALMESSLDNTMSLKDQELLNRVSGKLDQAISDREERSSRVSAKEHFLHSINYKQFLGLAAAVCLMFGVGISFYFSAGDTSNYEGIKGGNGTDATIPVTLTLRDYSAEEAIDQEQVAAQTTLSFSVVTEQKGFFALVKVAQGAKEVVVNPTSIEAGLEVQAPTEEGLYGYELEKGDDVTFCVVASQSRARLLSLLSSLEDIASLSLVGQCQRVRSE